MRQGAGPTIDFAELVQCVGQTGQSICHDVDHRACPVSGSVIAKSVQTGKFGVTIKTLLLGAIGGALLNRAGMPAGWLCGSMIGIALAALFGQRTYMPNLLRDATFVVLGTSMGSSLTPETLQDVRLWPMSIVILMVSVLASMLIGGWFLRRFYGWDKATARLSSIPGALSAVLAVASSTTANLPVVALSQTLRQLVLVSMVPVVLMFGHYGGVPRISLVADWSDAAVMLACGVFGSALLTVLRVPGAKLVGAMLASCVLHAMGWVSGRLDPTLMVVAFVFTGAVIGSRFSGTKIELLLATIRPAMGSICAAIGISMAFAFICQRLLGLPFAEIWLAYAPGGVEAMTIMAFALNLDPSYVSTHHVLRLLALMLLSPIWTYGLGLPKQTQAER
jgi:membrane AbrB-like protein